MIISITIFMSMYLKKMVVTASKDATDKKIMNGFFEFIFLLTTLLFLIHFSLSEDSYLLVLWLMSLTLSLNDYLYYLVEPTILYSLSLLSLFLFTVNYKIYFSLLLSPFFLIIFFYLFSLLLPNRIGGGDIKLLAIYAFFISFQEMLYLILIASSLGILFILTFNCLTKQTLKKLPFVPFLTIALIIVTIIFK